MTEIAESQPIPDSSVVQPMISLEREEVDWNSAIRNKFLKKSGEHLIEIGITGSGKTQGLYHLLNGILDVNPNECILWIVCGKSAEELKLLQFKECKFLFPKNRELHITLHQEVKDYTFYAFNSIPDIFRNIDRNRINILCLAPFFQDPMEYALVITEFFRTLIVMAKSGKLVTPMAIFLDEFQMVAPARGQALNEEHAMGGRWMQRNIDQLRSIGVRIVGAAQSWKKVLTGVRTSFGCIMIRQGSEFTANEMKRLSSVNEKWQALRKNEMVMAFRNRFYSDVIALPTYGDGLDVGDVVYIDHTNRQQLNEENIDNMLDAAMKKPEKKAEEEEAGEG